MGGLTLSDIMDTSRFDAQSELPAITPQSTKRSPERRAAHKARMAGKVYDRARRGTERTAIKTKADLRRLTDIGSIAQVNRHTGKPHENAREIMRNTMSPTERREFTAGVARQLGLAA